LKKQILLYATDEVKDAILLEQVLANSSVGLAIERHASIESFTDRLIHINGAQTTAVIYASSEKELINLYFSQHILRRVTVVLLLPDSERHTIALGHRLHPSFMCTTSTDVFHVGEVVRKIAFSGIAPQPSKQFRNPFESLIPDSLNQYHGHLTAAA
jgi:hypothetical protein